MYKVFTYQIEKPIFTFYNSFSTEECFDENGDYFIEYSFEKKDIEKNRLLKGKLWRKKKRIKIKGDKDQATIITEQQPITTQN